jgi:TRAP-type C4-dicarboxylate transport system substrate-binding protein
MKSNNYVLSAAFGLAVTCLVSSVAFAEELTLKIAGVKPIEDPGHRVLEMVAEEIEAADVGLSVKLFPAGQLGSGEELLEDTIRGNVDMTFAFLYAHKDPALEMNSLPFLASSWDEVNSIFGNPESTYTQIITDTLDRIGLVYLGTGVEGLVGVVLTEEPENATSIGQKGKHIRVWGSQLARAATETLGYQTTTMNWAEVIPAVQAGTVDGAICCTSTTVTSTFAKSGVGSVFVPYNAFTESQAIYASQRTWGKMNEEQRAVVEKASANALAWYNQQAQENDAANSAALVEQGWTVVEFTPEERAAISEAIKAEVWPIARDIVGEEVFDRLVAGN